MAQQCDTPPDLLNLALGRLMFSCCFVQNHVPASVFRRSIRGGPTRTDHPNIVQQSWWVLSMNRQVVRNGKPLERTGKQEEQKGNRGGRKQEGDGKQGSRAPGRLVGRFCLTMLVIPPTAVSPNVQLLLIYFSGLFPFVSSLRVHFGSCSEYCFIYLFCYCILLILFSPPRFGSAFRLACLFLFVSVYLFQFLFFSLSCWFVLFLFCILSLSVFRLLAYVCCACRTQYDGMILLCLNALSVVVCDHRACISLLQGKESARKLGVLDVDEQKNGLM